jgi:hypothetical protein
MMIGSAAILAAEFRNNLCIIGMNCFHHDISCVPPLFSVTLVLGLRSSQIGEMPIKEIESEPVEKRRLGKKTWQWTTVYTKNRVFRGDFRDRTKSESSYRRNSSNTNQNLSSPANPKYRCHVRSMVSGHP